MEKTGEDNWLLTDLTPEVISDIFYRTVIIEDVKRLENGLGDIDASGTGETLLPSGVVTKKITVRLEWEDLYQNP